MLKYLLFQRRCLDQLLTVGSGALVHGSTPRSRFYGPEKDQNQSKDQQSVKMS